MNKITDDQLEKLRDALHDFVINMLEQQEHDCKLVSDFLHWEYEIKDEDLICILSSIDIDTIEKKIYRDYSLSDYFKE